MSDSVDEGVQPLLCETMNPGKPGEEGPEAHDDDNEAGFGFWVFWQRRVNPDHHVGDWGLRTTM